MPKYHFIHVRGPKGQRINVDEVAQAFAQHELVQVHQEIAEPFASGCAGCDLNDTYAADSTIDDDTTYYIVEHCTDDELEPYDPDSVDGRV